MKTKYVTSTDVTRGASPSFTISTDSEDSQHDVVKQDGLTFRDPLPVLFGHDSRDLPVGMTTSIARGQRRTTATWRWLERDERASRVRNAFEQGALAASIGFLVKKATPNSNGLGWTIERAEVVEFSLVAVPANSDCVRTLKSLGLWTRDSVRRVLRVRMKHDDTTYRVDTAEVEAGCKAVVQTVTQSAAFRRIVQDAIRKAIARHTGRIID